MVAYSKHSITARSPNAAPVRLNLRMGPLKGVPSPTWCQGSKTAGGSGTPTLPVATAGSPTHLPGHPTDVAPHLSCWGLAWGPPSLPPAPSTFHSLTNRRKPAEQLIFMNRNSIRRRFLWAWGGVRRRRRAQKGRFITSRAGPLSGGGRSRLYCVNPFACQEPLCAVPAPPLPRPVRGGLRGRASARSPPRAPPTALIGC